MLTEFIEIKVKIYSSMVRRYVIQWRLTANRSKVSNQKYCTVKREECLWNLEIEGSEERGRAVSN